MRAVKKIEKLERKVLWRAVKDAPREKVYVGAKYGSGFIFCGTKEDFEKQIDEISAAERGKLAAKVEKLKERLMQAADKAPANDPNDEAYTRIRTIAREARQTAEKVRTFIKLRNRWALDEYATITPGKNAWIILYDGEERGDLWYEGDTTGVTGIRGEED